MQKGVTVEYRGCLLWWAGKVSEKAAKEPLKLRNTKQCASRAGTHYPGPFLFLFSFLFLSFLFISLQVIYVDLLSCWGELMNSLDHFNTSTTKAI